MLVILCFWSVAAVKIDILFVFLTGEHWCFMKLRDTQDYMTCNGYPCIWTEGLWPHILIFQLTGSFQHKFIVRNKEQNMITMLRKETSIRRKNLTDTRREGMHLVIQLCSVNAVISLEDLIIIILLRICIEM